jgi:hypothetical protein
MAARDSDQPAEIKVNKWDLNATKNAVDDAVKTVSLPCLDF